MRINIVKIINFPIGQSGDIIEIEQDFAISYVTATSEIVECSKNVIELSKNNKISEVIEVDYLFCIDDTGDKITLLDVSIYVSYRENILRVCQNGFIKGEHIKSINTLTVEKLSTLFCSKEQMGFLRQLHGIEFLTDNKIHVLTRFLTEDEDDIEIIKFEKLLGEEFPKKAIGLRIELISDTSKELSEFQEAYYYWRELIFVICGYFPNSFQMELYSSNKTIYYCDYNKRYLQKNMFYKKMMHIPCERVDWTNAYEKWKEIRLKTGISFDIFVSTIYAKTFLEDYPLRMIQCLEGFVYGLGDLNEEFVDYKNKDEIIAKIKTFTETTNIIEGQEAFLSDMQSLLRYKRTPELRHCIRKVFCFSDETSLVFKHGLNSKKQTTLIHKMVEHRNWFSHSKADGKGFKGNENIKISIRLILILRIYLMQKMNIEIRKSYLRLLLCHLE